MQLIRMEILHKQPNELGIHLDANIYNIEVVHKCFYWYGEHFDVEIDQEGDIISVMLSRKEGVVSDSFFDQLKSRIKRDMLDFKTRDIVTRETQNVRDLLIAKAFSHLDELDENPPGEVSDPVGFAPN